VPRYLALAKYKHLWLSGKIKKRIFYAQQANELLIILHIITCRDEKLSQLFETHQDSEKYS
jgi:hypothetical protein